MHGKIKFILISSSILCLALTLIAQTVPSLVPSLSELSKVKAENFQLKTQLAQCTIDKISYQAQVASVNLTSEQGTLEIAFKKELKCNASDKFNWQLLKCEAVSVEKTSTIK